MAVGFTLVISHTAIPLPLTIGTSQIATVLLPIPPPEALAVASGGKPLASGAVSFTTRTAVDGETALPAGTAPGLTKPLVTLPVETKMRTPAGTLLNAAFRRVP